jgi:hypothetical protein
VVPHVADTRDIQHVEDDPFGSGERHPTAIHHGVTLSPQNHCFRLFVMKCPRSRMKIGIPAMAYCCPVNRARFGLGKLEPIPILT